jgi:BASS family bile acid:Na+ symporter
VAIPAAVGAAVHQITGSFLAGLFARNMDRYEARKAAKEAAVAVGD